MKNSTKRLVVLGLTLMCFFSGYSEAGAVLTVSSDKSDLQIGQSATITATSGSGSGTVFFQQSPTSGGSFNPTSCITTGGIMSTTCSVQFYPTATGTFTISGKLNIAGQQPIQSQSATNPRIKVTQNTSGTPTLTGMLVDSTPPSIYQGDQVELKITASPIPTGGPTVLISSPTLGNIGTCIINTTAGGICTSVPKITLNTGIEGTHDINFSTTSWPNYTGTVSGTIKMTVLKTVTTPPTLDVCFPPKIKTATGACIDPSTINTGYTYLAPLSEEPEDKTFDPAQSNALSKYINLVVKIAIGIAAVLAVIMIVMGGIQYITSELISSKEEGKKRITNAILGLLIALGAYLILFTINPNLLKLDIDIPETVLEYEDAPEDNNYTASQANDIVNQAVQSQQVTIGAIQVGDVTLSGGGIVNKILNVATKGPLQTPKAIVMHWTAGSTGQGAFATFVANNTDATKKNDNGAHFIVNKDGSIWGIVPINRRANHFIPNATGKRLGLSNYNTIGIEIVGRGAGDPPTAQQISSTRWLVNNLLRVLNLTKSNIYGHGQIGVNRPADENLPIIQGMNL